MTVYVLEGPGGVVDLYMRQLEAEKAKAAMLQKGEWAQVRQMQVVL
jgi:hypothetical protein